MVDVSCDRKKILEIYGKYRNLQSTKFLLLLGITALADYSMNFLCLEVREQKIVHRDQSTKNCSGRTIVIFFSYIIE